MSRARFELRGIVDGTGDDRSMDALLIFLDIDDILRVLACDGKATTCVAWIDAPVR
jgi:hypothetical protein